MIIIVVVITVTRRSRDIESGHRTSFIDRNTRSLLYCSRGFCCGTGITRSAAGHLANPFFFIFRPSDVHGDDPGAREPLWPEFGRDASNVKRTIEEIRALRHPSASSPKASSHGVPLGASWDTPTRFVLLAHYRQRGQHDKTIDVRVLPSKRTRRFKLKFRRMPWNFRPAKFTWQTSKPLRPSLNASAAVMNYALC